MENWMIRFRKKYGSQKWIGFILISVVLAILLFLIYRERNTLLKFQWQIKPFYLILFFLFRVLAIISQIFSWHLSVKRINGTSSLRMDFKVYTVSVISRRIPGTIWQIGSKFALYPPDMVSTSSLVITTSLEFVLIGISGLLIYFLFMPFYTYIQDLSWQFLLGIGVILLIAFVVKPNLVVSITNYFLQRFHRPQLSTQLYRSDLVKWFALHSMTWLFDGASFYFWIQGLITQPIFFIDVLGISTISNLVSFAAQILPTGLALREITASTLLSNWIPISIGIVISLGYRIGMIIVELLLVVITQTALRSNTGKN